ncbi:MAG: HDOD domain-containing protein [Thermodesulfobacteriota bacterium]
MRDVEKIIRDINHLKPMPQVANKVMAIARNPKSSMNQLAEVITYDHVLTANLLKTCNSSYFGLPRKVDSVQQAIAYLGMNQVVDLVLLNGGAENLRKRQDGYDLDEGDLWRYSVSSALIARELAAKKGLGDNNLLFTAALLKDIGKVVLNQYVADSFQKISLLVSQHEFSFREAEKAVIGIDHAELGGKVAEKWGFSPQMVDLIRNHHLPEETARYSTEAHIVYLADMLCMMMGIGVGSDGLAYRFRRDVVEGLGFSDRDFQDVMAGFGDKLRQVEELVNTA